jgi:hypothetical protein
MYCMGMVNMFDKWFPFPNIQSKDVRVVASSKMWSKITSTLSVHILVLLRKATYGCFLCAKNQPRLGNILMYSSVLIYCVAM